MLRKYIKFAALGLMSVAAVSCYDPTQKALDDDKSGSTGLEYAPQMYHSVPYDQMTQIRDTTAGMNYFLGTIKDERTNDNERGEFYNSNPYNDFRMNSRLPVEGTVKRGELPYRIEKDDWAAADANPAPEELIALQADGFSVDWENSAIDEGESEALYQRFCSHCHGAAGKADGKVAEKFPGVPVYSSGAKKGMTLGHVFHTITYGGPAGLMGPHASQLSQKERWMISAYVQNLQKQ